MGGNWPRGSYGQGRLNVKYSLSFICSFREKARVPRIVFKRVRRVKCGMETGQFVLFWHPLKLFCEAKRKLLSRWRRCIILGGEFASQQLFNTQPKDNNIASTEVSSNHFRLSLSPNTKLIHPTEVFLFRIPLTDIVYVIFPKIIKHSAFTLQFSLYVLSEAYNFLNERVQWRTPKDMRKFILPNLVISINHVMTSLQEIQGSFLYRTSVGKKITRKIVISVSRSVVLLILWWFFCGQRKLFPRICRYYYISNLPHIKFY